MATAFEHGLGRALHQVADGVAPLGNGRWQFVLTSGSVVGARARFAEGWLEFTAALPNAFRTPREPLSWLRFNARVDGSVRAARATAAPAPELRAEWFVDDEPGLDACVAAACDEVRAALHELETRDRPAPRLPRDACELHETTADLERLCAEAGWPVSAASAGDPRLDLRTRAGDFPARFSSTTGSPDLLVVELLDLAKRPAVCQDALATLLLAASAAVRSVKGLVVERERGVQAALASVVRPVTADAVDRAASALAVACELAGREAQALSDERLAADYVARWGATRSQVSIEEEHACLQQP